jgi:hypothetical protein
MERLNQNVDFKSEIRSLQSSLEIIKSWKLGKFESKSWKLLFWENQNEFDPEKAMMF